MAGTAEREIPGPPNSALCETQSRQAAISPEPNKCGARAEAEQIQSQHVQELQQDVDVRPVRQLIPDPLFSLYVHGCDR